jgi:hypothetical protein
MSDGQTELDSLTISILPILAMQLVLNIILDAPPHFPDPPYDSLFSLKQHLGLRKRLFPIFLKPDTAADDTLLLLSSPCHMLLTHKLAPVIRVPAFNEIFTVFCQVGSLLRAHPPAKDAARHSPDGGGGRLSDRWWDGKSRGCDDSCRSREGRRGLRMLRGGVVRWRIMRWTLNGFGGCGCGGRGRRGRRSGWGGNSLCRTYTDTISFHLGQGELAVGCVDGFPEPKG